MRMLDISLIECNSITFNCYLSLPIIGDLYKKLKGKIKTRNDILDLDHIKIKVRRAKCRGIGGYKIKYVMCFSKC